MYEVPNSTEFLRTANRLNNLMSQMKPKVEFLKEIKPLAESLTDVNKRVKYLDESVRKFEKVAVEVQQDVKKALSVTDKIKQGLFKQVNPRLAAAVNMAASLISLGLTVMAIKANEEIQGYQITVDGLKEAETQQNFQLLLKQATILKALQKQYNVDIPRLKTGLDQTRADVASLDGNVPKIRDTANEALYEARAGRGILETKIASVDTKANNALYEARQGRSILDKRIDTLDLKVVGTSKDLDSLVDFSNKQAQSNYESFLKLKQINEIDQKNITIVNDKTDANTRRLDKVEINIIDLPNQVKGIVRENEGEIVTRTSDTVVRILQPQITDLKNNQSTLAKSISDFNANTSKQLQNVVSQQNSASKQLNDQFNQYIKDSQNIFDKTTKYTFETYKKDSDTSSNLATKRLDDLFKQLNDLSKNGENQRRMDQEANDKLAAIIPLLIGIPILTAAAIRPSIPTIPQIETAAATGTCKTLQPGGCTSNALQNLGNNINQNTNNAGNDLLNKLNAGANAVQLGMLNTINGKLGPQLPGGISTFLQGFKAGFEKLAKWLHIDRALGFMTFIVTVQNAYFLCDGLKIVLLQTLSNGLAVFGIEDKDGNPLNLNEIIGHQTEELLKGILGVETLDGMKAEWKALSRIYQAATNIMYAMQNMIFSVINALNVIGSWNAQIGNALKKYGVVGFQAFPWMNTSPNFHNKFFTAVFSALNVVSQLDFVAQSILSGRKTLDDSGKQLTDLTEALSTATGENLPDNKPAKDKATAAKTASKSPSPTTDDIELLQL